MKKLNIAFVALLILLAPLTGLTQGSYDELLKVNEELIKLSKPALVSGVPDLSKPAIGTHLKKLNSISKQLSALDVSSWPVAQQTDYLLVWSKLNNQLFDHRVMKPWTRDPLVYLYQISRVPYSAVPGNDAETQALRKKLQSVPFAVKNAKKNLKEPVGELATLALFHLDHFDGVGQGEPYRDEPPEGTIAWYNDLCQRLEEGAPKLLVDCKKATAAAVDYRDWLSKNLDSMGQPAAIGTENFNWYLRHVRLLPFNVDDLRGIGSREFHRFRFMYIVERNRNRNLPELSLTQTAEQHENRTRDAENRTRTLIAEQDLLTIPEYMPETFETDTYWSPRAISDRHFWEELQFRNALDNHIHASFPGHRFDAEMKKRLANPIRRTHGESARAEGWATYLEELMLLAGIADDTPRARELIEIALIKRGSRFYAELGLLTGDMTLDEANAYMIDWVPFMEEDLGRYDLAGYLRRPGLGSMYLTGKAQIEQLVSELAFQQGDKFNLGDFHDNFLSHGIIPVTLIRWEMTGLDNEVKNIWPDVVGKPFPAAK